jgi:NAD(P)-dependent dehydrogenase (short-subunit alcohol dehydrogenase family)
MIQETVPYMPSGGRIINIGAMGSKMYIPAQPAYCAAKAALDHSTRFLAAEVCILHLRLQFVTVTSWERIVADGRDSLA